MTTDDDIAGPRWLWGLYSGHLPGCRRSKGRPVRDEYGPRPADLGTDNRHQHDAVAVTRETSLTLDLYCGDFDLIYNNPVSLSITGEPVVDDNCDSDVEVAFTDTYTRSGDCGIIITRTFTATDDEGNANSARS